MSRSANRWEVEYDSDGVPVRMWWRGPEDDLFTEILVAELGRCPECGYLSGWHKQKCVSGRKRK